MRSAAVVLALVLGLPAPAGAAADHADHPLHVSGALLLGVSAYNPSYGALPDNSGLALLRYAAHVDVEMFQRRLFVPLDVTMFTDGTARGARKLAPSELDMMAGVGTSWPLPLALGTVEGVLRWEHDRPVGVPGFTQTYVDVRGTHYFSLADAWPVLGRWLLHGDVSGWMTAGWFMVNPSYAARPDNSGLALFRANPHLELSVLGDILSWGVDGMFFSDRQARSPFRPSEVDLTLEAILRGGSVELHVALEHDRPLDRTGADQLFAYLLLVVGLDDGMLLRPGFRPVPFELRNRVISP